MPSETDTPTQAMLQLCAKYRVLLDEQLALTNPDAPEDNFRRIGFNAAIEELEAIQILIERLRMNKIDPIAMADSIIELRRHAIENRTRYEGRTMVHDFIENAMASIMVEFYGLPPTRGAYANPFDGQKDEDGDEKIPFVW